MFMNARNMYLYVIYICYSWPYIFIAYLHATYYDLDVTTAESLPPYLSGASSQIENVLSSKRHHSPQDGRKTGRNLNEDVQVYTFESNKNKFISIYILIYYLCISNIISENYIYRVNCS